MKIFSHLFKSIHFRYLIIVGLNFLTLSCTASKIDINSSDFTKDIFNYLYENRQTLNLCEGEIDQQTAQQQIKAYKLDKNSQLIEFLCFLGAYQGNYQYFLYQETSQKTLIKPLTFDIYQEIKPQEITKTKVNSLGGIPEYNPDSQTLEIVTKYRGLGDCGAWGRYQWKQSDFELKEYRIKNNCDGQYTAPENYKIVDLD